MKTQVLVEMLNYKLIHFILTDFAETYFYKIMYNVCFPVMLESFLFPIFYFRCNMLRCALVKCNIRSQTGWGVVVVI